MGSEMCIRDRNHCMKYLESQKMISEITKCKNKGMSILGICLGAQLMLEKSAEGKERGLSFVKGEVVSFSNLFVKKNKK